MNKKKKIVIKLILFTFVCSLIFFLFKVGYKFHDDFISFGKDYLGIFFIPTLLIIFLDIFFTFINSKKKRTFYKTRLFFFIIFIVSTSSVLVLGVLNYLKRLDEINIINTCLMDYNLGFLMTHLITYIFNNFKLNHIFITFGILIFISLFFLIGKEIANTIRYFIKCKRRKEAMRLKKALLEQMQEQIAIKETLEEKKAVEYEKQNIILDTVIKEKVEKAIEKDILPLEIEKKDNNKEDKDENIDFFEEDSLK